MSTYGTIGGVREQRSTDYLLRDHQQTYINKIKYLYIRVINRRCDGKRPPRSPWPVC